MKQLHMNRRLLVALAGLLLSACTMTEEVRSRSPEPDVLTIYPDGSMRMQNRIIPSEDVVIYPDGYGGEKAAVKIWGVPFHPPFYRDSIVVERLDKLQVVDN